MRSKKNMRRTKKHLKNNKSKTKTRYNKLTRHNKRGGGFFDFFKGTSSVVSENCDPMKLTQLKSSTEMRNNYQTCCPKKYFGLVKDSSPYCKQLDLNFKSAVESEGMEKQYLGMEPQEVAGMQNAPMIAPAAPIVGETSIDTTPQNVGGKKRRKKRRLSKYRKH